MKTWRFVVYDKTTNTYRTEEAQAAVQTNAEARECLQAVLSPWEKIMFVKEIS